MRIVTLELESFRNYEGLKIEPGPGLNVFSGRNAQGKSNLLESIYVLATSKSTRAGKDTELIRFEDPIGRITASVTREKNSDVVLEMIFSQTDKKVARVNGVRHTKLAEVIGQLNAVLFDSGDLEIVHGEPAVRRQFLDLEIAQTSPRYVHALGAYRKTLEQRNRLLRDLRDARGSLDGLREVLPSWSAQLAHHGARLIDRRRLFLERLSLLAAEVHDTLSDGRDSLELIYNPSFPLDGAVDEAGVREAFAETLAAVAHDEIQRGTTLRGPQRDDLTFLVNGVDARLYGSQGQQRTVALSLKLAERQLIEELVGEPPILLLDDVLSDLDDVRRHHLFDLTERAGSQTFLSCTNLRPFSKGVLEQARVYAVSGGKLELQ
ncbi:MAG: DNA replication/repair protein RecF [Capsulimonas sp.]|uniref:DNA replication/repair protein RecF n=1 Tax=Capsulimonas sp. TaxID=2494211 RepID=UPI0032630C8E